MVVVSDSSLLTPEMKQNGYVQIISEMPNSIVYPKDLVEPLSEAMIDYSPEPEKIDLADIKLYALYDKEGFFCGTLYAVPYENGFYGNVVGETDICFTSKNRFVFKETNEVCVPVKDTEELMWCLICEYNREDGSLMAKFLKTVDRVQDWKVVCKFDDNVSFEDAREYF